MLPNMVAHGGQVLGRIRDYFSVIIAVGVMVVIDVHPCMFFECCDEAIWRMVMRKCVWVVVRSCFGGLRDDPSKRCRVLIERCICRYAGTQWRPSTSRRPTRTTIAIHLT